MPYVMVAADHQQLSPITGGRAMRTVISTYPSMALETIFRSKDLMHLEFSPGDPQETT